MATGVHRWGSLQEEKLYYENVLSQYEAWEASVRGTDEYKTPEAETRKAAAAELRRYHERACDFIDRVDAIWARLRLHEERERKEPSLGETENLEK
jgi:hypothetical protein